MTSSTTRSRHLRSWTILAITCMLAVGVAACSSDDDGDDTTAETTPERPLRILVSNDDGYDSEGIDALVEELFTLDDVEIAIAAPAEERSATGASATPGGVDATEASTLSDREAWAVDGYPVDSVLWALDGGIDWTPDVVVVGVNAGQNIGVIVPVSGTVNAALAASAAGVPSLAVSLELNATDYSLSAELAVDWVSENRDALLAGEVPAETFSINVPACDVVKELVEVPHDGANELSHFEIDCDSTLEAPTSDVEGFVNGFAVISPIDPIPEDQIHNLEAESTEEAPAEVPAG